MLPDSRLIISGAATHTHRFAHGFTYAHSNTPHLERNYVKMSPSSCGGGAEIEELKVKRVWRLQIISSIDSI